MDQATSRVSVRGDFPSRTTREVRLVDWLHTPVWCFGASPTSAIKPAFVPGSRVADGYFDR